MGALSHDYEKLKKEFISSDISIRALCAKHGIKGFSTVAKYAKDHGWYDERAAIHGKVRDKMVEKVSEQIAESEADEILQFRGESLTVIRAALYKFAEDLRDPKFHIRADEVVKLVQLGLLITGSPTERIEERRLDLHASFNDLPADVLRQLVDATRPRGDVGGSEAAVARTGAQGPRPN